MVLVSCTHDALAVAGVVVGSRAGGAFAVGGAVFAVGKGGAGLGTREAAIDESQPGAQHQGRAGQADDAGDNLHYK